MANESKTRGAIINLKSRSPFLALEKTRASASRSFFKWTLRNQSGRRLRRVGGQSRPVRRGARPVRRAGGRAKEMTRDKRSIAAAVATPSHPSGISIRQTSENGALFARPALAGALGASRTKKNTRLIGDSRNNRRPRPRPRQKLSLGTNGTLRESRARLVLLSKFPEKPVPGLR